MAFSAPGREIVAVACCRLRCREWAQASFEMMHHWLKRAN
jgi:hypothetical protein